MDDILDGELLAEYKEFIASVLLMQVQDGFELGGLRCKYIHRNDCIVAVGLASDFTDYICKSEHGVTFAVHPFIQEVALDFSAQGSGMDFVNALNENIVECLYLPSVGDFYTNYIKDNNLISVAKSLKVLIADRLNEVVNLPFLRNLEYMELKAGTVLFNRDACFNSLKKLTCRNITYFGALDRFCMNIEYLELPKVRSLGAPSYVFKSLKYADFSSLIQFDSNCFCSCFELRKLLVNENTLIRIRSAHIRMKFVVEIEKVETKETER